MLTNGHLGQLNALFNTAMDKQNNFTLG